MFKDKENLFEIMDKFEKSELSELTLKVEGELLKLKKGGCQMPAFPSFAPTPAAAGQPAAAPIQAALPSTAAEEGETIIAPLVGTFYRSPAPDAPPFVEPGSKVKAGDTLCILEAMKIMNELEADYDCEILDVLHESGTLAEFGTALFRVKRI